MLGAGAGAGLGERRLDHRRMGLGRVAVGGLEGDEAAGEAVMLEAEGEAAIRLAGGDAEQPAVRLQRVDQLGDALIERLLDLAAAAQALEALL